MNKPASKPIESSRVAPARSVAFEILRRVEEGAFSSILLAEGAEQLDQRDRALCHELVLGVLRRQLWLDRSIAYYARRDIERLDLPVKIALRLGLYQLRFLARVPSAAVNESVNLVRSARLRSAASFVNAVLRRAGREPDYDPAAHEKDPLERLSVSTSQPRWLIEKWVEAFGLSVTEQFAAANNEAAPTVIRLVPGRGEAAEILQLLRDDGAEVDPSQLVAGAWRVTGSATLLQQLSRSGQVYIQDAASQLVAQVLAAESGDRVFDVCAAPGSKATLIATNPAVMVFAGDIHEHRLATVTRTAKLHGLNNVQCFAIDAEHQLPFSEASFERVLVDAPCSGTGTLRHNPEIRWRISAADISELSARQRQILFNAAQVVKPGGRLVYSTCSVEPEESEAVVAAFLNQNQEFESEKLPVHERLLTDSGAARTWPHRDDTDGFFITAFKRKR